MLLCLLCLCILGFEKIETRREIEVIFSVLFFSLRRDVFLLIQTRCVSMLFRFFAILCCHIENENIGSRENHSRSIALMVIIDGVVFFSFSFDFLFDPSSLGTHVSVYEMSMK